MIVNDNLKVAIVCDWLTGIGGAEKVVLAFHNMFPDAPIYTSQYDKNKIGWFDKADVRTTWVNKLPPSLKKFLPVFRAISFSRLDLSDYDLILSSSGAEAKSVKTGPNTVHVCYCHSPTHYYWERYYAYLKNPGFGSLDWLARFGLKILVGPMRKWDKKAAQKPNYLVANSNYTKENILKYYDRQSEVIYPPVDIDKYILKHSDNERHGYVVVGRQTPYKKIDLAVQACTKLNLDLIVVGDGPEHEKLKQIAGPSIKFLGQISDAEKAKYLQLAKGFIFPGVDDFGIAAVEALAAGTPVVAYKKGGALDYINQTTGRFFESESVDSLINELTKFDKTIFNYKEISNFSQKFALINFINNLSEFVNKL